MTSKLSSLRFKDYYRNILQLDTITKFNLVNNGRQINVKKIILNFSFSGVNFKKKRTIPFFLVLELITGQKSQLKTNRVKKLATAFKLRKGAPVGCKVTLRGASLYQFCDYLLLALAKSGDFQGFSKDLLENYSGNAFSFSLEDLFDFYQMDVEFYAMVHSVCITLIFNAKSTEEKIFIASGYKLPVLIKGKNRSIGKV